MSAETPTLAGRLRERIRREGPLPFAAFMEAALYDPAEGFYARPHSGPSGDFATSPHVATTFAILLARQCAAAWEDLGRPRVFTVVEAGAGDGTLARGILAASRLHPGFADAIRYLAVERGPALRETLRSRGLESRETLRACGSGITGCVIANELLDNLPFHLLRERDGGIVEVMVGLNGEEFTAVEAPPTGAALGAVRAPLAPGEERPVSPAVGVFAAEVADLLAEGYAFVFDYGFAGGEQAPPVRAYRRHRLSDQVLDDPGSRDITAGVDFDALADAARRAGLAVWGPVSQRDALLALGFRAVADDLREEQRRLEASGRWREALRLYSERIAASILVAPGELGAFTVSVLGAGEVPAPLSVRSAAVGVRS